MTVRSVKPGQSAIKTPGGAKNLERESIESREANPVVSEELLQKQIQYLRDKINEGAARIELLRQSFFDAIDQVSSHTGGPEVISARNAVEELKTELEKAESILAKDNARLQRMIERVR